MAATLGVFLLLAFGLFLVAARIFSQGSIGAPPPADTQHPGLEPNPAPALPQVRLPPLPPVAARRADEIQNYVLFTRVPYGKWEVVTGIRYSSSDVPVITGQWCYLANEKRSAGIDSQLNLARMGVLGLPIVPDLTDEAVRPYGLTAASARKLIDTHCRFQMEG